MKFKFLILVFMLLGVGILCMLTIGSTAPDGFPAGTIIQIPKDVTVAEAAEILVEKKVIRSAQLFKLYTQLIHTGVQAGSYLLSEPQSALKMAHRIGTGQTDIEKIKVTIPEGSSSKEIAAILKRHIVNFDTANFLELARKHEGYLFPETYFFDPEVKPQDVITVMRNHFDENITELKEVLATSTLPLKDIIIMASIVEEEANNMADREIISGILWKRIKIGMPLQVDAPFYYLLGKGSSQLTKDDLAAASSYNTYVNRGLPSAPISNPGLNAIRATLNPKETTYFYYLADRKGVTHYAATHDGHVENKRKYLQ